MSTVTKRDVSKEPFIAEKIVVSAVKSGATPEVARMIAHVIEKNATDGVTNHGNSKAKSLACSMGKILNGRGTGRSLIPP